MGANDERLPMFHSVGADLNILSIRGPQMLGHLLGSFRPINVEFRPAENPGRENQVRIAGSVIGMKVRQKRDSNSGRIDGRVTFCCGRSSASYHPGAEIDEVRAITNDDRSCRA
jgi:hypothetical protein